MRFVLVLPPCDCVQQTSPPGGTTTCATTSITHELRRYICNTDSAPRRPRQNTSPDPTLPRPTLFFLLSHPPPRCLAFTLPSSPGLPRPLSHALHPTSPSSDPSRTISPPLPLPNHPRPHRPPPASPSLTSSTARPVPVRPLGTRQCLLLAVHRRVVIATAVTVLLPPLPRKPTLHASPRWSAAPRRLCPRPRRAALRPPACLSHRRRRGERAGSS